MNSLCPHDLLLELQILSLLARCLVGDISLHEEGWCAFIRTLCGTTITKFAHEAVAIA